MARNKQDFGASTQCRSSLNTDTASAFCHSVVSVLVVRDSQFNPTLLYQSSQLLKVPSGKMAGHGIRIAKSAFEVSSVGLLIAFSECLTRVL